MAAPSPASSIVTVGCKLPNGLQLNIYGKAAREGDPPPVTQSVVLAGANSSSIVNGHGITPGVSRELWDAWLAQNKDSDVVRNGLVFAHDRAENAMAEAKEKANNRSGMEGIDPKKLPKGIVQAAAVE